MWLRQEAESPKSAKTAEIFKISESHCPKTLLTPDMVAAVQIYYRGQIISWLNFCSLSSSCFLSNMSVPEKHTQKSEVKLNSLLYRGIR